MGGNGRDSCFVATDALFTVRPARTGLILISFAAGLAADPRGRTIHRGSSIALPGIVGGDMPHGLR